MCAPVDATVGIISKPVVESRNKLLKKNISNIKILVCLEEIQTQVRTINQRLESVSNTDPKVSGDSNQKEMRK